MRWFKSWTDRSETDMIRISMVFPEFFFGLIKFRLRRFPLERDQTTAWH